MFSTRLETEKRFFRLVEIGDMPKVVVMPGILYETICLGMSLLFNRFSCLMRFSSLKVWASAISPVEASAVDTYAAEGGVKVFIGAVLERPGMFCRVVGSVCPNRVSVDFLKRPPDLLPVKYVVYL